MEGIEFLGQEINQFEREDSSIYGVRRGGYGIFLEGEILFVKNNISRDKYGMGKQVIQYVCFDSW